MCLQCAALVVSTTMDDMHCWYIGLTSSGNDNSVVYKGIEQGDWGGLGPHCEYQITYSYH